MKTKTLRQLCLLFAIGLVITGCSNEPIVDSEIQSINEEVALRQGNQFKFNASLKGSNEVPANDSKAVGEIIVSINKDETSIHYKLIVANIENVLASHFHVAPSGANGGVVAFLYANPNPQPSGPAKGVLAEGDITSEDVINAFAGDLNALISAIREGNIYVNVHTTAIPSGEIRGQL
ncbi:MAG TPA: CHRD domain-containing protein [Flavobacteriaceae bacterium]|nr:CHRD domain-containing protein [Flavobacteriaceae bacterium]